MRYVDFKRRFLLVENQHMPNGSWVLKELNIFLYMFFSVGFM